MELKLLRTYYRCILSMRFNRTFMELKLKTIHANFKTIEGFNRTFMELKSLTYFKVRMCY